MLVLGSIHAPLVGTDKPDVARMYSVAWQRWEPANAETQSACILGRPPAFPVVVVGVKPAKRILRAPLQHASGRDTLQLVSVIEPALVMYVPLLLLLPLVHVEQLYPYR